MVEQLTVDMEMDSVTTISRELYQEQNDCLPFRDVRRASTNSSDLISALCVESETEPADHPLSSSGDSVVLISSDVSNFSFHFSFVFCSFFFFPHFFLSFCIIIQDLICLFRIIVRRT